MLDNKFFQFTIVFRKTPKDKYLFQVNYNKDNK